MQPAGPMCPAHTPATIEQPKPKKKKKRMLFCFFSVDPLGLTPSTAVCALLSFLPAFCLRHLLYYFLQLLPPNFIKIRVQNIFGHRLQEVLRRCPVIVYLKLGGGCCWDSRLLPTTIKCRYSLYTLLSIAQLFFFRYIAWCVLLSSSFKRKKRDGL